MTRTSVLRRCVLGRRRIEVFPHAVGISFEIVHGNSEGSEIAVKKPVREFIGGLDFLLELGEQCFKF